MPKDTFTSEQIQKIVKEACEIDDSEKRELFIKQACNENEICIEKVKFKLPLSQEEPQIHNQITEEQENQDEIVLSDAVLEILQGKEPELLGKKIGGYLLTKQLGKGGMAHVYRGAKYDEGEYEDFAIKVIINQNFSNEYFLEETEKLKRVDKHTNIARLHKSGIDEESNYPYFVLEYINGKSLTDYCEDKTLSLTKRLTLFLTVCEAVKYLHTKAQIIHCDIKPSNILVSNNDETPSLIDFGIAKIISRNSKITKNIGFTFENSSPELVSDKEVSKATDIYSLGAVLYELLTSHKTYNFQENSDWESMKRIVCKEIPELPSQIIHKNIKEVSENRKCSAEEVERFLKGEMDRIILKCLKKEPEERYETVEKLIKNIESFKEEWEKSKQPDSSPKPDPSLNIVPSQVLKSCGAYGLTLGLLTLFLHSLVSFFPVLKDNPISNISNTPGTYLNQALLCLLFFGFLFIPIFTSLKNRNFESKIARDSFHQFLKGVLNIWITWFWLYLYIYIMLYAFNRNVQNAVVQSTVDFLNASTSITFFYMFLVMDMPSVASENDSERNRRFQLSFKVIVILGILVVLYAGFGRFTDIGFGIYVSGFFAAVSMLYFFGRLDSHYMNINRWLLAPLFSYASIQVIGPKLVDFGLNSTPTEIIKAEYQDWFFIMLLILKGYLFILLFVLFFTKTFFDYFNSASNYIEDNRFKTK